MCVGDNSCVYAHRRDISFVEERFFFAYPHAREKEEEEGEEEKMDKKIVYTHTHTGPQDSATKKL